MFSKENRGNTLSGIFFVALFATTATYIAEFQFMQSLALSPLIIGIILGMIYANTLRNNIPKEWQPGINFSMKQILRFGIILYGFRLTFSNIEEVGVNGVLIGAIIVATTFIIGYFVGTKVFKLDRDVTILTSAGSSICGAAAVLGTEPVIKAEPYKSAIAVSTVVVFGTIAMILYPFVYKLGIIPLDDSQMGIYIGATVHEVAHVVGAANAVGDVASTEAIIIKMIRVMMLAPFLLILSVWIFKTSATGGDKAKLSDITIPWFAIFFIVVVGFNSLDLIAKPVVTWINHFDTFLLTMAMTALGMETSLDKFKNVGLRPIYLAFVLFIWLIISGFFLTKWLY
jgi:uncharacterized integral membrane protein (TIGR00698 family)